MYKLITASLFMFLLTCNGLFADVSIKGNVNTNGDLNITGTGDINVTNKIIQDISPEEYLRISKELRATENDLKNKPDIHFSHIDMAIEECTFASIVKTEKCLHSDDYCCNCCGYPCVATYATHESGLNSTEFRYFNKIGIFPYYKITISKYTNLNPNSVSKIRVKDPIFDITLVNFSSNPSIISEIGFKAISQWVRSKGYGLTWIIKTTNFYEIFVDKFVEGQIVTLRFKDPIFLASKAPLRFKLRLRNYHEAVEGNETIISLIVKADDKLFFSEEIYLGLY